MSILQSVERFRILSTNCKAYWSNEAGWVGKDGADVFNAEELKFLVLPIEGRWVPADSVRINSVADLADYLKFLPREMKVSPTFKSSFNNADTGLTVSIVGLDEFDLPVADDDFVVTYGLHCQVCM